MPKTPSRPRGRPPIPCGHIYQKTFGRKTQAAKDKIRAKMCNSRVAHKYYKCIKTKTGCATNVSAMYSKIHKNPMAGVKTYGNPLYKKSKSPVKKRTPTKKRTPPKKPTTKKRVPKITKKTPIKMYSNPEFMKIYNNPVWKISSLKK